MDILDSNDNLGFYKSLDCNQLEEGMPRIVDHSCQRSECGGTRAKWYGRSLHCTTCDAWQRHKVTLAKKSDSVPSATKSRIWKDIKTQKQASVEFECPMCGNFNHTKDWKQIDEEVFRVLCAECSSNCIVRG